MAVVKSNYQPHPKQMLLHKVEVSPDEITIVFFGGDRGGGKSAGILGDCVMFAMTYPGSKICIVRETIDAVKQSFLDKLPTLFPATVNDGFRVHKIYEWKEKSSSFHPSRTILFPNGSYITLQPVADFRAAMAKQGWEFNYLAIDEITKQSEQTFKYLLTTVRSSIRMLPDGKQYMPPIKIVCSGNPGGPGHKWVKRLFIDTTVVTKDPKTNRPIKTKPYIEYVEDPRDGSKIKKTIMFIPASWRDNKFLNSSYVANLMSLPETKRKMDMDGNWDVVAGRMFEPTDENFIDSAIAVQIIREQRESFDVYISLDWGYRPDYHAAHWHLVTSSKRVFTFMEAYGQDLVYEEFVKLLIKKSEGLTIAGTCVPHDFYTHGGSHRDETGKFIGETKADVLDHYNMNPIAVASGKGKVQLRYDKIHSAFKMREGSAARFVITTACPNLRSELEEAVHDEHNPLNIAPSCLDHAIDSYGHFLVFFSEDIFPIEEITQTIQSAQSNLQRKIAALEEKLKSSENFEEAIGITVDDYDDMY